MTTQTVEPDLYKEWSAGISMANPPQDEYFESLPMNVDNPAEFHVAPEQIPQNPQNPQNPVEQVPPQSPPPDTNDEVPETLEIEGGGTLTLEKTSKGWHAVLDSGEANIPAENFYGSNLKKLALNMAKGKLAATKAILKLKKEKLLGGDEAPKPVTTAKPAPSINVSELNADDVYAIKQKWNEDRPDEAFNLWLKKQFGVSPEEFAKALKSAEEANKIVEAQRVKGEIDEVNSEFVRNNPDWNEEYGNIASNLVALIARMSKAHLGKSLPKKAPQAVVDTTIYELFAAGAWTVENLERAKDELIDSGLLEKSASAHTPPQPQPQPAAPPKAGPSAPEQGIPGKTGQNAGANFGLPVRGSGPPAQPENTPPSDVDLYQLPLDQLRAIARAQLAQTGR